MKRASTLWTALCLTVFLFSGNILSAQNVLWSSDFNGGLGAWTTQDKSRNASGDNWIHSTTGPSGAFAIPPINSTSRANGWAQFDSDLLCSGSQNAWLISPAIDLSGTDTALLVFSQYYRKFHDQTFVQVSTDGGTTWTAYQVNGAASDGDATPNPDVVTVDISATAAGNSAVQIAFQFTSDDPNDTQAGCGYAWQVDDVRIDDGVPPPPPADPSIIWTEEFDGGANGWTNNNISVATDTATWFWEPRGYVGNGLFAGPTAAIASPSAANGAMVYNADVFTTGGDGGMAPTGGPPYPQYISELISPVINISGNTFPISVRFHQLARLLNPSSGAPTDAANLPLRSSISWSTDGGTTWSVPVNANPDLAPNANRPTVQTTIPVPVVKSAANFRIKFTFACDFYFWVVDDVQIVVRRENNMRINDFYGIAPNAVTPASQVEPFGFVADIANIGGFPATNVNLNVTVKNPAGTTIYSADQPYGTIAADSTAENVLFGNFTPPATVGVYTGAYSITLDSTDADPANNVINWDFEISQNIFAKDRGATRNVAPAADESHAHGNCYYVVNGSDWAADMVTFGVANADDLTGRFVTLKLYEWDGDTNEDGAANADEYNLLAFNSYQFDGTESDQLITIPVDIDNNKIQLKDNTYYIPVVEYQTDDAQDAFLLASDAYDYNAMWFRSDSLGNPRYGPMLDVGLSGDLGIAGFSPGFSITPVVRLSITPRTSTKDLSEDNLIKVFPNPANEFINLDMNLTEVAADMQVSITDLSGKILRNASLQNIQKDNLTFSVRDLPTGSYHVRIVTKNGMRTLPFVVQR